MNDPTDPESTLQGKDLSFCFYVNVSIMWVQVPGAHRDLKRPLDPVKLELKVAGCHLIRVLGPNSNSLEEQLAIRTTEPSHQHQDVILPFPSPNNVIGLQLSWTLT